MDQDPVRAGERLLSLGRFAEALDCFRGVGDDLRARFGSAAALHLLGRFEEAENGYEAVLETDPKHSEALSNLIAMSVERFDLERVERYSRRLLALDNDAAAALQGLVIVAVERRDYESAARFFQRIRPASQPEGDAIEYRLSRETLERLRSCHGATAHPY